MIMCKMDIFLSIKFTSLCRTPPEIHYTLSSAKRLKTLPAVAIVVTQALVYKGATNHQGLVVIIT